MTDSRLARAARHLLGRPADPIDYWNRRARDHGRRAVLNLSSTDPIDAITQAQTSELFPHLVPALNETDKVVLDFGCGPGRFTPSLAALLGGTAIGVDPVEAFLEIAPRAENVEYRRSDGHHIPLSDDSVDVVWICLVLGGIRNLEGTVHELRRVARPEALVFIAENTSEKPNLDHWHYRSVDDYRRAFATRLDNPHDYFDGDERISVMVGRI